MMDKETLEECYPIGSIFLTRNETVPPIGKWKNLGFNIGLGCYVFKRVK